MKLQQKAERLAETIFVGGPTTDFERVGRDQLIRLLNQGLYPDSKVLDIGCGVLRGGYWLIHFLDPGCYFGIEPNQAMLDAGIDQLLEPGLIDSKQPGFDNNADFDFSVFGEKFDFFVARSIWSHASKQQIEIMLDSFLANSTEGAVFLASYLRPRWYLYFSTKNRSNHKVFSPLALRLGRPHNDYSGDEWIGRSHASDASGTIRHNFGWIQAVCQQRGLTVIELDGVVNNQIWLKISRNGPS